MTDSSSWLQAVPRSLTAVLLCPLKCWCPVLPQACKTQHYHPCGVNGETEVRDLHISQKFCPLSLQLLTLLFQALPHAWLPHSHLLPTRRVQLYPFSVKRLKLTALPLSSSQPHYCCHADEALVQKHKQECSALAPKTLMKGTRHFTRNQWEPST